MEMCGALVYLYKQAFLEACSGCQSQEVGEPGPSSHLESVGQTATQPALEQAIQSFLKGL